MRRAASSALSSPIRRFDASSRIAARTGSLSTTTLISVCRCDRFGPTASSRSRRNSVRSSRATRRIAVPSSAASPRAPSSASRSRIGSPNFTSVWRPCNNRRSSCLSAPGATQLSANSALMIESWFSGARPQKMLTGTICTSTDASPRAAATMRCSRSE